MNFRIFGYDQNDLPGTLINLKAFGISSVVGHGDPEGARFFSENGIRYYAVHGCFFINESIDSPENYSVDITGKRTKWFSSACPNSPAAVEKCLLEAKKLAAVPGVSGVIIDGARYASPMCAEGPEAFFICFCDRCTAKMKELDLSADIIHSAVSALYEHCKTGRGFDPSIHTDGIKEWLLFRRLIITRHLKNYAERIKETDPAIEAGMYIFTPSLSVLVGQSYADLSEVFDFLSPMLYRHYEQPVGTACFDHELTALLKNIEYLSEEEKQPILELYEELTGLPFKSMPSICQLKKDGCPVSFIENEICLANKLAGNKTNIFPIFMLKDRYLNNYVQTCRENEINSIDFFIYEKEMLKYLEGTKYA